MFRILPIFPPLIPWERGADMRNLKTNGWKGNSMKRFVILLALMVTTLAAMAAGGVSNFNGKVSWKGNVTGQGSNTTDVTVTDKGGGLYDINIKALTVYGRDSEITFTNVPGTAQGEGVVFSTNGQNSTYTVNSAWGDQIAMTVEGKMLGDQLYLFCSGKVFGWSDDPFTITYGEDLDISSWSATYIGNAVTTFGDTNEQTFENSKVDVYATGKNKYRFVIKQYQLGTDLLGDFTAVDVTGTPNADGSFSYSFYGKATASNTDSSAISFGVGEGTEVELKFSGRSKGGKLYLNAEFNISGNQCTYVFGEEDKPYLIPVVYPGVVATRYPWSSRKEIFENSHVDVYKTGENKYKFIFRQYKIDYNDLGDLTAVDVTGTTNADGSISYYFVGEATFFSRKNSGIKKEVDFKFEGKSIGGELYINGDFNSSSDKHNYRFSKHLNKLFYNGNASSLYKGTVTNFEKVSVDVDEMSGADTYICDFVVKQVAVSSMVIGNFTVTDVVGTKKSDGSINYSFEGKAEVTNVGFAASQTFGFEEGDSINVKLNGESKDGKLHIELMFKDGKENDVVYTFDSKLPAVCNYKDIATSFCGGEVSNFDEAFVDISEAADGSYDIAAKQVRVFSVVIADITATGVAGKTNSDGSISFSYKGLAKTTNVGSSACGLKENGDIEVDLDALSKDGKLDMVLKFKVKGDPVTYMFGEELKASEGATCRYTDKVSACYQADMYDKDVASVDISETGAGVYKFVVDEVEVTNKYGYLPVGGITITDVAGTANSDGSISYSFEGNAVEKGSLTPLKVTLNAQSYRRMLYMTLKYKKSDDDLIYTFGDKLFDNQSIHKAVFKIGDDIVGTKTLASGQTVTAIEAPAKEGHTFAGWNDIPATMPDHDIEIVGSYTVNSYHLTYILDGETYKEADVPFGTKLTPEAAPEKKGYIFSGWQELPETMPAHDVEVNGVFNVNPDEDTDISAHSDILYFDKTAGVTGSQVVLSLKMRNRLKAVAYQCDLYLPDGVEVAKNADGSYKIELSTERTTAENSNVFKSAMQSDGCIRILSASTSNIAYNGNDGEVATIVLQLSDSLEEGDLPIILRNVEIADANSANNVIDFVKSTLTVSAYTVGDVNNDGRISITDFTAIVEYLMGNVPAVFIEKAADISGDGKISVTDLTSLVPLIMQGTNASPRHASPSMNSESAYAELSAADCFMGRGMECTVDVKVTGNYNFSAYQFDLDLPEGVRVKMQNGKPCVTLIKSSADDHLPNVFTSGIMPDGSLRVLGATTDGALVNKADGCIARITLVADRDAAYGLHNATVGNIVLAANGHDIEPEPTAFSISVGDATGIDGIDAGEECGNIYDVAGKLVKKNGTTKGLKQGIYIMNGKKVLK